MCVILVRAVAVPLVRIMCVACATLVLCDKRLTMLSGKDSCFVCEADVPSI